MKKQRVTNIVVDTIQYAALRESLIDFLRRVHKVHFIVLDTTEDMVNVLANVNEYSLNLYGNHPDITERVINKLWIGV